MVETPVLYITFARPEYASQSFAAIKAAKPKKLYFYSNKARSDRPEEVERNNEVRGYINQIDWECEVKTWFREDYVDVFTSLWGAIDWVFDNEEKAIIIEEDVVASFAFFDYIDQLIDKYSDNERVWMISGNNACPQYNEGDLSYFPTRFPDIYGWASWKSRWKRLDKQMSFWPEFKKSESYNNYYHGLLQKKLNYFYFEQVYKNIETYNPWDFIFTCNMVRNGGYCLMPNANLSKDIGITGVNHGQALQSPLSNIGYFENKFLILKEPKEIYPTKFDNNFYFRNRFCGMIRRKIRKFLHF